MDFPGSKFHSRVIIQLVDIDWITVYRVYFRLPLAHLRRRYPKLNNANGDAEMFSGNPKSWRDKHLLRFNRLSVIKFCNVLQSDIVNNTGKHRKPRMANVLSRLAQSLSKSLINRRDNRCVDIASIN